MGARQGRNKGRRSSVYLGLLALCAASLLSSFLVACGGAAQAPAAPTTFPLTARSTRQGTTSSAPATAPPAGTTVGRSPVATTVPALPDLPPLSNGITGTVSAAVTNASPG